MRFGGSSWRAKFDPKKLRERTKNDSEKHRTRRGEKKGNKNDKKGQQEIIPIIGKSHFGARGSLGRTTYQRKRRNLTSSCGSNTPLAKGLANFG